MQVTDKAREFIQAQLKPIDEEAKVLQDRLNELEAERSPLVEALKALEASKKRSKSSRKPSLPSVKKEDVQPICLTFAKENPNIERSVLESLVEEKLVKEAGFGRNGLKMQIRKCLDSDLFAISKNGMVSVASPSTHEM